MNRAKRKKGVMELSIKVVIVLILLMFFIFMGLYLIGKFGSFNLF